MWDFDGVIKYWSQSNVLLNQHIQAGRARHIENPIELPRMSEIAKGTVFGAGIHGHTVEIKRGTQWLTCKIITHKADSAPTNLPNLHLVEFDHTSTGNSANSHRKGDIVKVDWLENDGTTHAWYTGTITEVQQDSVAVYYASDRKTYLHKLEEDLVVTILV